MRGFLNPLELDFVGHTKSPKQARDDQINEPVHALKSYAQIFWGTRKPWTIEKGSSFTKRRMVKTLPTWTEHNVALIPSTSINRVLAFRPAITNSKRYKSPLRSQADDSQLPSNSSILEHGRRQPVSRTIPCVMPFCSSVRPECYLANR